MADPKRNQKQIAQRYSGNLDYFKKPHYLRLLRVRSLVGLASIGLLVAAAIYFSDRLLPADTTPGQLLATFHNPGPISQAHAQFELDCAQCHGEANHIVQSNLEFSPVDTHCIACHENYELHQPNVTRGHSCTACHHEHVTSGPMRPVHDANCRSCHASEALMAAARESGQAHPEHAYDTTADDGMIYFKPDRPAEGYTAVFRAFDQGHPEFQIHRDNLKDSNSLAFNHHIHLSGDTIPELDGRPLNCADCHQPDASGRYLQPINYEAHCQSCHSLQFDPQQAGMELPHGDSATVLAYVRSLDLQYEKEALRQGYGDPVEIKKFSAAQLKRIREALRTGIDLEERIFFQGGASSEEVEVAGLLNPASSEYPSCAYCHEVERRAGGLPHVTEPLTPDRWLGQSRFDHSKHKDMDCTSCHQVENSELTSDILLPTIANCLDCHSQKGQVVHSCQTCHGYHAPASSAATQYWLQVHLPTLKSKVSHRGSGP
jgi:hypothetical protein